MHQSPGLAVRTLSAQQEASALFIKPVNQIRQCSALYRVLPYRGWAKPSQMSLAYRNWDEASRIFLAYRSWAEPSRMFVAYGGAGACGMQKA